MHARQQTDKQTAIGLFSEGREIPDFNALARNEYTDRRRMLLAAYEGVRRHSQRMTSTFSAEELQIQSMPEASPVKWHLAHTSWFFETFILASFQRGFRWFDEHFCYLFNSYYNAVGKQYPRAERGLMSRPNLQGVLRYREHVDEGMLELLQSCTDDTFETLAPLLVLGLNHEQQHQELIATDLKHALFQCAEFNHSVGESAGSGPRAALRGPSPKPEWLSFDEAETRIGFQGSGFCFDNELAAHAVLLTAFELTIRPVNNGQWLEFMHDGGYDDPLLWLSDGWAWKSRKKIQAPLYWRKIEDSWVRFTPDGMQPVGCEEPVRHISYYEADAFAAWSGARLPRETEWEHAARLCSWESHPPGGVRVGDGLLQLGRNWEWTQSAYSAYPGFRPTPGMAGEYNGKFMVNQMVLRGASRATSVFHSRPSYRNFFYPDARWQFSGLRLARNPE